MKRLLPNRELVVGTNNRDKCREIQKMLSGISLKVSALSDHPECGEVHENGRTFEENAKKKARAYSKHTGALVLADDSGLMVNYLNGRPGVYSARFAGPGCTYQDNNRKLLRLLKKLPAARRGAKFVCVMALYDRGRFVATVKGECRGHIAERELGANGFGYDPVFIPEGYQRSFGELSPSTKNRLSHRGKALRNAKREIIRYLRSA